MLRLFRKFEKFFWLQALFIFFLALSVRLTIATVEQAWIHPDRAEMEREAISLAHWGVLGNPYSVPTGPSAHVNPGYALLLALIYRMFGTSMLGEAIKAGFACLTSSAGYALLPLLANALRLGPWIGFSAGLFGALVPLSPYVEIRGDFENHVTAVLLLLLILWTERLSRWGWSIGEALAFGVFCGISALTSSVLLPLDAVALVYVAYRQSRVLSGRPAAALLSGLALFLCLLPWAERNAKQLSSPILTRSNFGLEFFLANNDIASPLMLKNNALYECCHPLQNVAEARKVLAEGEVAYNRRLLRAAIAWVKSHPMRFAKLVLLRIWYTWMPTTPEPMRELLFRALTPLSLLGVFLIAKRHKRAALLLAAPLMIYPLPLYLVQVHLRYRQPINFIVLLTAAAAVVMAATKIAEKLRTGNLQLETVEAIAKNSPPGLEAERARFA